MKTDFNFDKLSNFNNNTLKLVYLRIINQLILDLNFF